MTELVPTEIYPAVRVQVAGGGIAVPSYDGPGLLTDEYLDRLSPQQRVDQLVGVFLAGIEKESTRRAYRYDLAEWLAFCANMRLYPLTEPKHAHAQLWKRFLGEPPDGWLDPRGAPAKPAKPSTVARRLSGVSEWYKWLLINEWADRNPMTAVKRPKRAAESPTLALSREQAAALLDAAATDRDPHAAYQRNYASMELLINNGLRGGELVDLTIGSRTLWRGQAAMRVVGKGGKVRTLRLAAPTVQAIDWYMPIRARHPMSDDAPLFCSRTGKKLTHSAVFDMVRRVARLAHQARPDLDLELAVKKLSPHGLRHTSITGGIEAGRPIQDVQHDAGHASPVTTQIYNQSVGAFERSTAPAVAAWFASARQTTELDLDDQAEEVR